MVIQLPSYNIGRRRPRKSNAISITDIRFWLNYVYYNYFKPSTVYTPLQVERIAIMLPNRQFPMCTYFPQHVYIRLIYSWCTLNLTISPLVYVVNICMWWYGLRCYRAIACLLIVIKIIKNVNSLYLFYCREPVGYLLERIHILLYIWVTPEAAFPQ